MDTFEGLSNLLVLEQFRDSVLARIGTYVSEHKVRTAAEAAVLADDYVLIHLRNFSAPRVRGDVGRGGGVSIQLRAVATFLLTVGFGRLGVARGTAVIVRDWGIGRTSARF